MRLLCTLTYTIMFIILNVSWRNVNNIALLYTLSQERDIDYNESNFLVINFISCKYVTILDYFLSQVNWC